MTDRIKRQLELLKYGEYTSSRKKLEKECFYFEDGKDGYRISSELMRYMLKSETPFLFPEDRFGFNRSIQKTPTPYCGGKKLSPIGNLTINYSYPLSTGMDAIEERIRKKLSDEVSERKKLLYTSMLESIEDALSISDRYRDLAKKEGASELYNALCKVPHKPAESFYEACVFLKFLHFTLRCNRNCHLTLGRFDQYMLPYFFGDISRGVSEDELFETLEEFFITINIDSDTYYGAQKGDNGMSMVLGGRDADGNDQYNRLSELCIKASSELCLIDPKINLRVDRNTPISRLEFATELTKKGLGFPQYCNDEIAIEGLRKLGYSEADACDYTVAACWEFIIPSKGFDIPNISKVNFPKTVEKAVNQRLEDCESFEEFLDAVRESVREECERVAYEIKDKRFASSPYLSIFVDDCIERGLDVSEGGAVYNNYGAHGVGISSAADAIAAIKSSVFEGRYTATELVTAIKANFQGYGELRNFLLSCPKMGNNDDSVDIYAELLMDIYTEVFSSFKNTFGGVLRAGTGSALEYLKCGKDVGATADGRLAETPFGVNFSPSPTAKVSGPLSCIMSFTKYDMTKIINGGPLTMEIHDNTFRNEDGIKKVAALVKAFIDLGGHQLQLNSVNREVLLDARAHPEDHKNLIVRVWGWSGYFNELDRAYQDHIINRVEFMA